jgi:hypothetical protein
MPTGLTNSPQTGFWVSPGDVSGNKSSKDIRLAPAPTSVEYPNEDRGEVVETADGRVVFQASSYDPRLRTWSWANYGPTISTYESQQRWLESLRSRLRYSRGQSPYVYVYDGTTGLFNLQRSLRIGTPITVSGTSVTIPNISSVVHPGHLKNAVLEVLPAASSSSTAAYERRTVFSATNTSLTLTEAFSTNTLGNSRLLLTWEQPVWWRVRVLDAVRDLRKEGGLVRYTDSRFRFTVDDDMSPTVSVVGTL